MKFVCENVLQWVRLMRSVKNRRKALWPFYQECVGIHLLVVHALQLFLLCDIPLQATLSVCNGNWIHYCGSSGGTTKRCQHVSVLDAAAADTAG